MEFAVRDLAARVERGVLLHRCGDVPPRRAAPIRRTVHLLLLFFYSWLWSLFRGAFYLDAFLSAQTEDATDYNDVLGMLGVAQTSNMTSVLLSCTAVLGDTALLACSLWMLPMTAELSRLARKNMDRGPKGEREAASWYSKWIHIFTVIFLVCEAAYTIYNRGFNNRSYRILISGNMLQGITLVYVVYVLISLKCSGRNYETMDGSIVLSPLYKRIKGIMYVRSILMRNR